MRLSSLVYSSQEYYLSYLQASISLLATYSLVLFALHFPFFYRREVKISYYTAFLGGIGYVILIQTICTPLMEEFFPQTVTFYSNISHFASRAFSILCILSFVVIIFYKLQSANRKLQTFMYHSFLLCFILTVCINLYNYSNKPNYELLASDLQVEFLDILYLAVAVFAIFRFRFLNYYSGILPVFLSRQKPYPIVERVEPANREGVHKLKNYLWLMYEVESWSDFIDDFWFNIVIDETLDNAIEHGGRRYHDVISVYVFETNSYLDLYVKDMGKGFDPDLIPDPRTPERKIVPTGRGIHILLKLFPVSWNFVGNEIKVRIPKENTLSQ
ncbi:MAG: ATP-binding protein [Spirochaetota bacterium]